MYTENIHIYIYIYIYICSERLRLGACEVSWAGAADHPAAQPVHVPPAGSFFMRNLLGWLRLGWLKIDLITLK